MLQIPDRLYFDGPSIAALVVGALCLGVLIYDIWKMQHGN